MRICCSLPREANGTGTLEIWDKRCRSENFAICIANDVSLPFFLGNGTICIFFYYYWAIRTFFFLACVNLFDILPSRLMQSDKDMSPRVFPLRDVDLGFHSRACTQAACFIFHSAFLKKSAQKSSFFMPLPCHSIWGPLVVGVTAYHVRKDGYEWFSLLGNQLGNVPLSFFPHLQELNDEGRIPFGSTRGCYFSPNA